MITDAYLQLSSAQAVTASAVSTNTIDLGVARDIGTGEDLEVHISVDVAATAAGAATVNFQVITSASANLSTPTILGQTDAIPKTSLTVGARFVLPIPPSIGSNGQRYFGVQYTVATGPLTAGSFTATVVKDVEDRKTYASGFSVT